MKEEQACVPARGDIVWISMDPQAGHEQRGRRPALVLSPAAYNEKVGLALLCPITSREMEPLMGKPVHCFSGRITRLQQRGLVRSAGRVRIDGSSMNAWTAVRRE